MTPGQYLAMLSACGAIIAAIVATRRGDHGAASVALAFVACIIIMRIFKAYLHPDLHMLAFAGLWVAFGSWAIRKRRKPVAGAMLIASGLCYGLVEYTASPTAYGFPLMVGADIAGYAALFALCLGASGGGRADLAKTAAVGRGDYRRPDGTCACGGMDHRTQQTKGR